MKLLRAIDTTKPVKVYRNRTRKCWSVMQGGLVVAHTQHVALRDVRLVVGQKSRATVVRKGKRGFHAYAKGYLCDAPTGKAKPLSYNPFKNTSFMVGGKPASKAQFALFNSDGSFVL